MNKQADANLLFGILALQMDFIDRDQLISSMNAWLIAKNKALGDVLVESGVLSASRRELIDGLVSEQSRQRVGQKRPATDQQETAPASDPFPDSDSEDRQATAVTSVPADAQETLSLSGLVQTRQRYEILRPFAEGGLGEVFIASDSELHREVALKQIKSTRADEPDSRKRFVLEAEITGRLEHPGVVPVYGMGTDADGRPYYAMRFIKGETLKEAIDRYHGRQASARTDSGSDGGAESPSMETPSEDTRENLELRKLLQRFISVCQAIEYAHSRGILHRDIKPNNIMLGRYGETLVVDWGLAKSIGREESVDHEEQTLHPEAHDGSSETRTGAAVGTPAFMSPEQAAGRINELTPTSDVYSLGATLYYLLTGAAPFGRSSIGEVLQKVQAGKYPPPRSVNRLIAKPLEAVCVKAMATDPQSRYSRAKWLAADVERWLADEAVAAYREPRTVQLKRWLRRHKTVAVSGSVAAVLLWIGLMIGAALFERARQQRQFELARQKSAAAEAWQSARKEFEAGDYASSYALLDQMIAQLKEKSELARVEQRFLKERDHVQRFVDFYRLSDATTEGMLFEHDTLVLRSAFESLELMGVFNHADWWAHLPVDNLPPKQRDKVLRDVYRQLYLLVGGSGKFSLQEDDLQRMRSTIRTSRHARRFRESQVMSWTEDFLEWRIGLSDANRSPLSRVTPPDWRPVGDYDYYALGSLLSVLVQMTDNQLTQTLLSRTLFGIADPKQQSVEYLRQSALREPENYAVALINATAERRIGNLSTAMSLADRCIALRRDQWYGYALRASLVTESLRVGAADSLGSHTLARALRDAEVATELDPNNALAFWILGEVLLATLDHQAAAHRAYREALKLESPTRPTRKALFRNLIPGLNITGEQGAGLLLPGRLKRLAELTDGWVREAPDDASLLTLSAMTQLVLGNDRAALKRAERVLALVPTSAEALTIRAAVKQRDGRWQDAIENYSLALANGETSFHAQLGMGECFERLGRPGRALALYQTAANAAKTDWQKARALGGVCRIKLAQTDLTEARRAAEQLLTLRGRWDFDAFRNRLKDVQTPGAADILKLMEAARPAIPFSSSELTIAPGYVLPILNADFELGLTAYWGDDRATPVWANQGGCDSDASVVKVLDLRKEQAKVNRVLHIRHRSPPAPERQGSLIQVIPRPPAGRYRLSYRVKAEQLLEDGVKLLFDDVVASTLDSGTSDWKTLHDEFAIKPRPGAVNEPLLTRFQIVSTASGECWIDDVHVELIEAADEDETL